MADRRDLHPYLPYKVDEKRGIIELLTYEDVDDEEEEVVIQLTLEWKVCGTCGGNGKHVNPSIDAHGISAGEFERDPQFAEEYFRGDYDVTCNECKGKRVVPHSSDPRFIEALEEAWNTARDDARTLYMETGGSMGSW